MRPQPSPITDQIPRKKRKWDQPSESLISSGLLSMPTPALTQPPLLQLQVAAVVHKLNQPKIQEDLVIAREIVINDADPAMRYKLTKRQTQEEIQKCTGAVVITRGKYRSPNAIPDGEKPLYLHISSGAHIKETAERVLVVDRAAAMVDDMIKQVTQPLSTCVYVGFDADPSLNIAARIRGPNDQYINHIINETGATVVLRGHRSGYLSECEDGQPPLHLSLSSNNQKSLEDARLLAENLLDTISRECGASRVSSCKLYGAVPPPPQLSVGLQSSGLEFYPNYSTSGSLACLDDSATAAHGISNSLAVDSAVTTTFSSGKAAQTRGLLPSSCSQTNKLLYSQPISSASATYSAYAGVYPQATPREPAFRQSCTVTSSIAHPTSATDTVCASPSNVEKRPPQKRKFQEAPTTSIVAARSKQWTSLLDVCFHRVYSCGTSTFDVDLNVTSRSFGLALVIAAFRADISGPTLECTSLKTQQPLVPVHGSMSFPSSRSMPPPAPLPPKFSSPTHSLASRSMPPPKATSSSLSATGVSKDTISNLPNLISVPDTLVKLMEYGDDDDDDEDEFEAHKN